MRGASTPEKQNVNPHRLWDPELRTNRKCSEGPGEKDPLTNYAQKLKAKTIQGTSIDSVRRDGIQPGSQKLNSVKNN